MKTLSEHNASGRIARVSTGVEGLDEMLGGGLPLGRCILICGGPGSGKTIFGIQFLYDGVTRYHESGLYVSLDESPIHLKENMAAFGWNLDKLEKKQQLAIIDASPIRTIPGEVKIGEQSIGQRNFRMLSLIEIIRTKALEIKAQRIVVDPITSLIVHYPDVSEKRNAALDLFEAISRLGTTNLITTELHATTFQRTIQVEEFLSHGVIVFHVFQGNMELVRAVQIEKMRGLAHDQQIRPYRIGQQGIAVYPKERSVIARAARAVSTAFT